MKVETKVIHSGEEKAHFEGAVSVPIFQSANYITSSEKDYHDIKYIRLNNTPNHHVLHQKLTALEKGEAALVTASGMGAISTALLTVLKPGDRILAQECLYGGTLTFILKDLSEMGVTVSWIDVEKPGQWTELVTPNTKVIYLESIGNPLTQVGALDQVPDFAKKHDLVSIIDNTVPSPLNFQPLTLGFDLVVHSATKYLNGHSDIVAGAMVGGHKLISRIKHKLDHLGASLDPHACFLLNRGIKTLALRMKQHEQNAMELARFLEGHPRIKRVYYPGLESHPNHQTARKLFSGFSGLLSFELAGPPSEMERVLQRLRIPLIAPSLGGVETLVTCPARTSHSGLAPEERKRIGISDTLLRVSLGIEDAGDLIEDFRQALDF